MGNSDDRRRERRAQKRIKHLIAEALPSVSAPDHPIKSKYIEFLSNGLVSSAALGMWVSGFGAESYGKHPVSLMFFIAGFIFFLLAIRHFRLFDSIVSPVKRVAARVIVVLLTGVAVSVVWWHLWPEVKLEDRANLHRIPGKLLVEPWQSPKGLTLLQVKYPMVMQNTGKLRVLPNAFVRTGVFIRPEFETQEEEEELFATLHDEEGQGSLNPNFIDPGFGWTWDGVARLSALIPGHAGELDDLMNNEKVLYVTTKSNYRDSEGGLYSESCKFYIAREQFSRPHLCWGHDNIIKETENSFRERLTKRLRHLIGR